MRYVAIPAAISRLPLTLYNTPDHHGGWTIIAGPTESGLYILEATEEAIDTMKELYDGFYLFMEDF
jgi:hypothetical protein